jgi:hypothetical protein
MASFESSFARAMSSVRSRVDDVIQGFESGEMEQDAVVQQMWAIPEEVRQITREAVNEASQISQVQVVEQLDCVMQMIPEEFVPDALLRAKEQIVATVPHALPETIQTATEAAENNVRQATRVVEATGLGVEGVVANRVVADTLMRAKVGNSQNQNDEAPTALRLCNPGTIGHPELCSRACLYFPLGKCGNGANCAFCHAPHSKRATHLDKRHREIVKSMGFVERFHIIMPILKAKMAGLGLNDRVMESFHALAALPVQEPVVQTVDRRRTKDLKTLQVALNFMSARSLLSFLQSSTSPEDTALVNSSHRVIDTLMLQLRPQFHASASVSDSQADGMSDFPPYTH